MVGRRGEAPAAPSSRTGWAQALLCLDAGRGVEWRVGGQEQPGDGGPVPPQQPGYKKQPVPVRSKATLPCSAQWEDENGFPWLPHQGREYSDQTRVKGRPVSFSLNLVWGRGAERGSGGESKRCRGSGGTCALPATPTLCPG